MTSVNKIQFLNYQNKKTVPLVRNTRKMTNYSEKFKKDAN